MPNARSVHPTLAPAPAPDVAARCPRARTVRSTCLAVLLASLVVCAQAGLAASMALAQDDCEPVRVRGPVEVMPASGANDVLLDAPLRVRFSTDYFASTAAPTPEESFELRGPDGLVVDGEVQLASDDVLFFLPTGGWQPNAVYAGTAFGEVDLAFGFRTGSRVDMQSPTVAPLSSLGSTRVEPSCQSPDGGYRLDLAFAVSHDDGSPGSIEYHLYLARAEGLEAPVEVAVLRNFTADASARVPISFVLERRYAMSAICLQLQVSDGAGNLSVGTPYCLDPVEGANFAGLCALGPRPDGRPVTGLLGLLVTLAVIRRRAQRRRASLTLLG